MPARPGFSRSRHVAGPVLLACLAALVLVACGRKGSGVPLTETREVAPFKKVLLKGALDLELVQDPGATQAVEVVADDNLVGEVTTKVEYGELTIDTPDDVRTSVGIKARVHMPALDRLALKGAGDVSMKLARADDLAVVIEGAGDVKASGHCKRLTLELSGAGNMDFSGCGGQDAKVRIRGAGTVDVRVSTVLEVQIDGAGTVGHHGQPGTIKKEIKGVGSVVAR